MVIFIVCIALILLQQKKKLESHKKVCENKKDFCNVTMTFVDTKILEFNIKNLIKHHLFIYEDPCII